MRLRAALLLARLATVLAQSDVACRYPVSVIELNAALELELDAAEGIEPKTVRFDAVSVGSRTDGPQIIDSSSPSCLSGNCPVFFTGVGFANLLSELHTELDILCYFGGNTCSEVRSREQSALRSEPTSRAFRV